MKRMEKDTALEEFISRVAIKKAQRKILELCLTLWKEDQKLRIFKKKSTKRHRLLANYQHSKVTNKLILLLLETFINQELKDYQMNHLLPLFNSQDLQELLSILNQKIMFNKWSHKCSINQLLLLKSNQITKKPRLSPKKRFKNLQRNWINLQDLKWKLRLFLQRHTLIKSQEQVVLERK